MIIADILERLDFIEVNELIFWIVTLFAKLLVNIYSITVKTKTLYI